MWAPVPPLPPPPAHPEDDEGLGPLADGGLTSSPPRALDIIINAISVCACVVGPYMAMTGLRYASQIDSGCVCVLSPDREGSSWTLAL